MGKNKKSSETKRRVVILEKQQIKPANGRGQQQSKKKPTLRSVQAGVVFPVARLERYLRARKNVERISGGTAVFLAAVLEYLTAEILVSN
jgi:hypothetical protein